MVIRSPALDIKPSEMRGSEREVVEQLFAFGKRWGQLFSEIEDPRAASDAARLRTIFREMTQINHHVCTAIARRFVELLEASAPPSA